MSLVAKLLPPANVLPDLAASSKKRLFEQVGLLFENQHGIARGVVFESLFARERLGSTGLGQGVAIPHGRIKGLKDALGAFVRLSQPVPFDAPDGKPVNLVFALLVPGARDREAPGDPLGAGADVQRPRAARGACRRRRRRARCTRSSPHGSRMLQVNVAQLHEDNREALSLAWVAGREGRTAVRRESAAAAALIGHLNLTHPNSIQVIGVYESGNDRRARRPPVRLRARRRSIFADGVQPPPALLTEAERTRTPLFTSPLPAPRVIEKLSSYLAKRARRHASSATAC